MDQPRSPPTVRPPRASDNLQNDERSRPPLRSPVGGKLGTGPHGETHGMCPPQIPAVLSPPIRLRSGRPLPTRRRTHVSSAAAAQRDRARDGACRSARMRSHDLRTTGTPGARRFALGSRSLLHSRDTPKKGEHALSADQAGRLFLTTSRRELGADADDRVSSRAGASNTRPQRLLSARKQACRPRRLRVCGRPGL